MLQCTVRYHTSVNAQKLVDAIESKAFPDPPELAPLYSAITARVMTGMSILHHLYLQDHVSIKVPSIRPIHTSAFLYMHLLILTHHHAYLLQHSFL